MRGTRRIRTALAPRMAGFSSCTHLLRIGDIDRSVAFYEKLGLQEQRRMPIRDEAIINVFMGTEEQPRSWSSPTTTG